jgi:hypothetical protein
MANSPVWVVLYRHTEEMEGMRSFPDYKQEETCNYPFPPKIITSLLLSLHSASVERLGSRNVWCHKLCVCVSESVPVPACV